MFNHFFNSQTKTVTFAAIILGISALISRLLGLVRDRLLAGRFGAGEELDVYFAAFRIPDFVYGIIIMGGVTAVFLPVFAQHYLKDKQESWALTNNVLNCFLILMILVCGILAIFTPLFIKFITPGFRPEQIVLTVSLTRIMFLSPIFLGLSSVFSGVLHYFNRFLAYSLSPVLYNLGIIFGILVLVPIFGIWGLAYGVVAGAFLHWVIQIPAARAAGFKYQPTLNFKQPGLVRIFQLMIPRTIGTAAHHLNLIIITAIASTLNVGSIAIFTFSNNLRYFPIGIIGASFAISAFPALSRAWVNGQKREFLDNFSSVLRQILFLVLPVSFLMFLLRAQLVRLILGTGEFGWLETRLTAASLGLFCFSIFAASLIPFLARVFYSFQDTKTPVVIGLFSIGLNLALSFFFVWLLSFSNAFQALMINFLKLQGIPDITVVGLALALSFSAVFQFLLLIYFLRKKFGRIRLKEVFYSFIRILTSSIFMIMAVYLVLQAVVGFIDTAIYSGLFLQTTLAGLAGCLSYFLAAKLLKCPEVNTIKHSIFHQFSKG